jgi:hypothetical protein
MFILTNAKEATEFDDFTKGDVEEKKKYMINHDATASRALR